MGSKDIYSSKSTNNQSETSASTPVFSLLSSVKDSTLDDVFSKSASLTVAQPVSAPQISVSTPSGPSTQFPVTKVSKKDKKNKHKGKQPVAQVPLETNEEAREGNEDPEKEAAEIERGKDEDEDEDEDGDGDLVHESLKSTSVRKNRQRSTKAKYTPPGETAADRDRRTIFVGNLPVEVAKSKSILSQFRAHILSFVPTAKIESIRFRSVAFATPTSSLPSDDIEKDENRRAQRERERAAAWKVEQDKPGGNESRNKNKRKFGNGRHDEDEDEKVDSAKVFLDSKGKRKVAFIKKDFHAEMSICNAYIVFEHPHPDRPINVRPILDPYVAASTVISAADGSSFLSRTLRIDSPRLSFETAAASSTSSSTSMTALARRDAWLPKGTDPKKSLFVGGLDYAAKEEDLRAFFEALVVAERGEAGSENGGKWVTAVRIVRDKETQMGKGFGYVHFIDRESVDEIIALNSAKLKFAKRPLRVQPCKTLPSISTTPKPSPSSSTREIGAGKQNVSTTSMPIKSKSIGTKSKPTVVPKGDPSLGEKIKDLSKDERKAVKSSDPDRLARRLAKKKSKFGDAGGDRDKRKAVSLTLSKADREKSKKKVQAKQGRKRSENAVSKMKGQRV